MHNDDDATAASGALTQQILILQDPELSRRLARVPGADEIPDRVLHALAAVIGFLAEEDSSHMQYPDTNRG